MLGWAKAGPLRQKMIEGIKQLDGCFIFCFRAKEKTKPVKKEGKTEIIDMGFMPIAGEEWVYEMAVNCMLEPRSDGVPTWRWFEEFDTSNSPDGMDDEYFETIVLAFLATGAGRRGLVGAADSILVPAAEIVAFAVRWMEEHIR